jgi:hypothetical protein
METEGSLPHSKVSVWTFRNKIRVYREELLAPRPTSKLEDHPLSAARDCLLNIFAATLHTGGRSSILNLRTRHALVTGTHLSRRRMKWYLCIAIVFPPGGSGRWTCTEIQKYTEGETMHKTIQKHKRENKHTKQENKHKRIFSIVWNKEMLYSNCFSIFL